MKKARKITALALTAAMALTLAACSGQPATQEASSTVPPTSAPQESAASQSAITEPPNDAPDAAPQAPANAEVVYSGDGYTILRRKLFEAYHPWRSDIGTYKPVGAGVNSSFNDGLILIVTVAGSTDTNQTGGKKGYADINGNVVIPCQYESAGYFSEGLAAVKTYNEWTGSYSWGFINTAGEMVIPAEYDSVHSFSEGMAAVSKGEEWGYIDASGNEIIPIGKYLGVYEVGHGYLARDFHDGLAYTEYDNGDGYRYACFINKTGEIAIDFKTLSEQGYHGAWDFNEGLARVGDPNGGSGVYGFMDTAGNIVVELPDDIKRQHLKTVSDFYEGFSVIKMPSGKSFVIDETGNTVFSLEGKDMEFSGQDTNGMLRFSEGLIPVKANASNKYGFVDTSGEVAVPFRFDLPVLPFSCGLALTQNGEYIDKNGEVVIPRPAGDYETTGGTTFYENTALQVGGKGTTTVYSLELVTN